MRGFLGKKGLVTVLETRGRGKRWVWRPPQAIKQQEFHSVEKNIRCVCLSATLPQKSGKVSLNQVTQVNSRLSTNKWTFIDVHSWSCAKWLCLECYNMTLMDYYFRGKPMASHNYSPRPALPVSSLARTKAKTYKIIQKYHKVNQRKNNIHRQECPSSVQDMTSPAEPNPKSESNKWTKQMVEDFLLNINAQTTTTTLMFIVFQIFTDTGNWNYWNNV